MNHGCPQIPPHWARRSGTSWRKQRRWLQPRSPAEASDGKNRWSSTANGADSKCSIWFHGFVFSTKRTTNHRSMVWTNAPQFPWHNPPLFRLPRGQKSCKSRPGFRSEPFRIGTKVVWNRKFHEIPWNPSGWGSVDATALLCLNSNTAWKNCTPAAAVPEARPDIKEFQELLKLQENICQSVSGKKVLTNTVYRKQNHPVFEKNQRCRSQPPAARVSTRPRPTWQYLGVGTL